MPSLLSRTLAAVEHGLCAPDARPLHNKGLRFARLVPAKLRGDDKAADKVRAGRPRPVFAAIARWS